jgi:Arabinose efflux permease
MEPTNMEKLWSKDFILICLISFCASASIQILNNTTPLYVDSLGGTAGFSGILSGVFTAAAVISRVICGNLADKKGRRLVTVWGCILFALSTMAYNIFPYLQPLLIARLIQGLGFAAVGTATGAAVADVLPENRMGEGIGYYGLGQALATAIGPYLGLALIFDNNFKWLYWITTAIIFVICILSSICRYEKNQDIKTPLAVRGSESEIGNSGLLRLLEKSTVKPALIQLINTIGASSIVVFLALFAVKRGFVQPGLFFTIAAMVMIIARLYISRYVDHCSPRVIVIPGVLCGILGLLILAFCTSQLLFFIAGALYGAYNGLCSPVLNAVAIKEAPVYRRGAATATFYICVDMGIGLGGMLWGFVIDHTGFSFTFCAAAVCMALSIILSLIFFADYRYCNETNN